MRRVIPTLLLLAATFSGTCNAQPHWYKSKKFWIPLAVNVAAMTADYGYSQRAFSRGAIEADPIFAQQRPGAGRMFSIGIPLAIGYSFASCRLSESKHKPIRYAAIIPTAYFVTLHIADATGAMEYGQIKSAPTGPHRPPRF